MNSLQPLAMGAVAAPGVSAYAIWVTPSSQGSQPRPGELYSRS